MKSLILLFVFTSGCEGKVYLDNCARSDYFSSGVCVIKNGMDFDHNKLDIVVKFLAIKLQEHQEYSRFDYDTLVKVFEEWMVNVEFVENKIYYNGKEQKGINFYPYENKNGQLENDIQITTFGMDKKIEGQNCSLYIHLIIHELLHTVEHDMKTYNGGKHTTPYFFCREGRNCVDLAAGDAAVEQICLENKP